MTATIHRLAEVGSTMDAARTLAEAGAAHRTVVTARMQHGGRGRGGRVWASPVGNLHATVVLRPGGAAGRQPELGFVVALAVAEAVDALAGPGTGLKWPNDVLRNGAKLAGILCEATGEGAVLAGIGMNVASKPPDMPYPITSLHALGCTAAVDTVLDAILARLDAGWAAWQRDGFGAVLARWRVRGPVEGAPLQVRLDGGIVAGSFAGLAANGAMLLQTPQGQRTVVAGDVLL